MDTHLQENSGVTDLAATSFKDNLLRIRTTKECMGNSGIVPAILKRETSCERAVGLTLRQVYLLVKPTASTE